MEEKLPAGGRKLDSLKIQLQSGWLPLLRLLIWILGTVMEYPDESVH